MTSVTTMPVLGRGMQQPIIDRADESVPSGPHTTTLPDGHYNSNAGPPDMPHNGEKADYSEDVKGDVADADVFSIKEAQGVVLENVSRLLWPGSSYPGLVSLAYTPLPLSSPSGRKPLPGRPQCASRG
jgi:hypothetical protein